MSTAVEAQHGGGIGAAEVAGLLAPAFPGAPVETAEPAPGGRNTNIRVTVAGRDHPYLLRIHANGPEAARVEWDVARLAYRRAPVPAIIWTDASSGPGGRPCSIHRWVEGVPLSDIMRHGGPEDIRQAARAAGETLARIGGITFREAGFFGPGLAIAETTGRLAVAVRRAIEFCLFRAGVAERLGEQTASRVWTFATRYAHRLDRLRDTACLVHGGFHPEHILLRRDPDGWAVAAVLDWEDAFSGSPLWDVGMLLRHADSLAPDFAEPFLAAFAAAGGEAPSEARALARLCDLVPLMRRLTGPEPDPEALAAVRATADRLVTGG